jgi:hypothetical protein
MTRELDYQLTIDQYYEEQQQLLNELHEAEVYYENAIYDYQQKFANAQIKTTDLSQQKDEADAKLRRVRERLMKVESEKGKQNAALTQQNEELKEKQRRYAEMSEQAILRENMRAEEYKSMLTDNINAMSRLRAEQKELQLKEKNAAKNVERTQTMLYNEQQMSRRLSERMGQQMERVKVLDQKIANLTRQGAVDQTNRENIVKELTKAKIESEEQKKVVRASDKAMQEAFRKIKELEQDRQRQAAIQQNLAELKEQNRVLLQQKQQTSKVFHDKISQLVQTEDSNEFLREMSEYENEFAGDGSLDYQRLDSEIRSQVLNAVRDLKGNRDITADEVDRFIGQFDQDTQNRITEQLRRISTEKGNKKRAVSGEDKRAKIKKLMELYFKGYEHVEKLKKEHVAKQKNAKKAKSNIGDKGSKKEVKKKKEKEKEDKNKDPFDDYEERGSYD